MIDWTPELEALAFSTRAAVNPAWLGKLYDDVPYPFEVKVAYANARDWDHQRELRMIELGRERAPQKLRPVMDRVIEARKAKAPPSGRLDLDVEAALVALEVAHTFSIVAYWIAKEGVDFAIRALVRAHGLVPSHYEHTYSVGGAMRMWIEEGFACADHLEASHAWSTIRAVLALTDEKTYARARAVATELRKSVPLGVRAWIAFAFPDEQAWADADAEAALAEKTFTGPTRYLATVASAPLAERLIRLPGSYYDDEHLVTLIKKHGDAAAPLIGAAMTSSGRAEKRKDNAKILARIRAPEAARAFAEWLADKAVAPLATKYFRANPELAPAALGPLAKGTSKLAPAAKLLLSEVGASVPASAKAAKTPAKGKRGVPAANVAALPPVLASPPWLGPARAPMQRALTILPYATKIVWRGDERSRMRAGLDAWEKKRKDKGGIAEASTDERLIKWIGGRSMPLFWIAHIRDTSLAVPFFEQRSPGLWWSGAKGALTTILAAHDLAVLPAALRFAASRPADAIDALSRIDGPEVAPFMADVRQRIGKLRPIADAWLVAHPEAAAVGLIPLALGKPGAARDAAESSLSSLRARGHEKIVDRVAARYGKDAQAAIASLSPLGLFPTKLPKLPPFAEAAALPAPILRAGGALPTEAVTHLLTMMAFSPWDDPYAGLTAVKDACTPESLRDFAWALFERWLAATAPPTASFAIHALGLFGDDEIVRRLAPMIRSWPNERAVARAQLGLEVLGRIGTDSALAAIDAVSRASKFESLREKAADMIAAAAAARGLSEDELGDRIAPDVGGRSIDDKMDKAARSVIAAEVARLESAMVRERAWTTADFTRFVVAHPLVGQIARRLVWSATPLAKGKKEKKETKGAPRVTCFRVAEDGTFADAADRGVTLGEDATIRIAHPLHLSTEDRDRWSRTFGEYEILPPFEQLARRTFEKLPALVGARLEPGRIQKLIASGWQPGGDETVTTLTSPSRGVSFVVEIEPGFERSRRDIEPQTITAVTAHGEGNAKVTLKALAPVAASELARALLG